MIFGGTGKSRRPNVVYVTVPAIAAHIRHRGGDYDRPLTGRNWFAFHFSRNLAEMSTRTAYEHNIGNHSDNIPYSLERLHNAHFRPIRRNMPFFGYHLCPGISEQIRTPGLRIQRVGWEFLPTRPVGPGVFLSGCSRNGASAIEAV